MKAEGKVIGLNACDDRYPGAVVVELTCSLEHGRFWAAFWGKEMVAELSPLPDAGPVVVPEPAQSALPGIAPPPPEHLGYERAQREIVAYLRAHKESHPSLLADLIELGHARVEAHRA